MRSVLLFLASLLIGGPVGAQAPDTLDAAGYFPLSVGNEWEYAHYTHLPAGPSRPTDDSRTEYLRYQVVDDASGPSGDRFALVEARFTDAGVLLRRDTVAVAYDSETASVVGIGTYDDGGTWEATFPGFAQDLDVLLDSTLWDADRLWNLSSRLLSADLLPTFLAGTDVSETKEFVNFGGFSWVSVHTFGFVSGRRDGDGCSFYCPYETWRVTFAVVDGVTYGARAVGVNAGPGRASSRLSVYPNPARARVTVEAGPAAGGREVTMYDLLGRLVRSARLPADGATTLSLGGLAPGLYVVRVGGDTHRVVVR